MSISKNSGTTLPTFKFRSGGGIELISAAIKKKEGMVNKFFVKESENSLPREVAYYDTVIESSSIRGIIYDQTNQTVTFNLRDGGKITLDKVINKSDIITPENPTENAVVLFGTKNGGTTELRDSGLTITDSADDVENEEKNGIPTSNAVRGFVTGAAEPLKIRLAGSDVNKNY